MEPAKLWKPSDPGFIADPYPVYRRLLAHAPVFQAATGDYVVLGYEEVKQVLLDKSCKSGVRSEWVQKMTAYASGRGVDFQDIQNVLAGMPIELNPPEHTQVRSLLAKSWPSRTWLLEKATQLAREISATLPSSFDLVTEVSKKLPLWMICEVLGIPRSTGKAHLADGFQLVQLLSPYLTLKDLQRISKASANLYQVFQAVYRGGKEKPDALVAKIKNQIDEDDKEVDPVALLIFLFIAGFETTSTLISTCLYLLLSNKNHAKELEDEQSIARFIGEVLRLYPPAQLTGRTNTLPLSLSGLEIPAGSTLTLCLGAANRDSRYFEEADLLNPRRKKAEHLSFGYGMHHCLGSQMAVIEASALIQTFLPAIDKMALMGEPAWGNDLTIRSIISIKGKYLCREA